ncbi:Sec1 family domain-containing protein [Fasciola hepatica]|uniref:Sec1 family domain-containing protein n=1 Tax=Fasciola hepatica TaxID=6192 RepID=A0A4E0RE13_FASHE|nr:Sec1 family domain-containing protein [Fasciola hepatica]
MVCSTLFTCLILISESIKCMLNFNSPPSTTDVPQWKVLIYDHFGRDIISPLLTVKELRALGVTLHLLLDSSRENIPDVPAIYFVYPSEENIFSICKDFEADRYESYYLNFISPISRELLESVAQTALSEDCVQRITKVFDQYTNFICLEDDLVVLRPPASQSPSYYALNRAKASDIDVEHVIDTIVDGLFSVFATLGVIPIIRCPRGDASEMVATRLEAKLRDSLRDSRNSLFLTSEAGRTAVGTAPMPSARDTSVTGEHRSGGPSFPTLFQRPLLVLLDRNLDLATPLHHEMSYQSLVHDIFNIRLNRVQVDLELAKDVPTNEGTNRSEDVRKKPAKLEQYDLSTSTDRLWREFKGAAFSDVAEAIREEVTTLRTYEKRMGELRSAMGLSAETGPAADSTLTLLDDNTARLTSAIRRLSRMGHLADSTALKSSSGRSMLNKLVSHGSAIFFTGMRHLIGRKSYLPFTRIVSQLMENKSGAEVEEYRYFDPKLYRRQNVDMPRFKQPFYEAFVFVIGGGSYVEYQNLIDWTRESAGGSVSIGSSNNLVGTVSSTNNTTTNGSLVPGSNDASGSASSASLSSSAPSASARRITYGCTEVVSPTEFLDQLTKLGHEL